MRRLILLIIAMATLLPSLAQAYDVLVLQSRRDPACDEVLNGFNSDNKSTQRVIVLSDYSEVDVVRIVREDRPRMILAMGDSALVAAKKVLTIPILAVLTLQVNHLQQLQSNLFGISMIAPPEPFLATFQAMKKQRIGMIYNPAKSGWYVQLAQQTARQMNIDLVLREVTAPSEAVAQLASMAGKIDALWMMPDFTAVTRETFKSYSTFAKEQSIPLVSFAKPYLKIDAAAVVAIDWTLLGRQAADLSRRIYTINEPDKSRANFPQSFKVISNRNVLNKLGID